MGKGLFAEELPFTLKASINTGGASYWGAIPTCSSLGGFVHNAGGFFPSTLLLVFEVALFDGSASNNAFQSRTQICTLYLQVANGI